MEIFTTLKTRASRSTIRTIIERVHIFSSSVGINRSTGFASQHFQDIAGLYKGWRDSAGAWSTRKARYLEQIDRRGYVSLCVSLSHFVYKEHIYIQDWDRYGALLLIDVPVL